MQKRLGIHAAGIIGMPSLGAAGAVLGGMTYAERLYTEYVDAVYAMTDIPPLDTTIYSRPSAAYDGTLTLGGGTLQDSAGPVTGGFAPLFDGATGHWNIGAITAIWNGAIGGVGVYGKVSDVADWSDGVTRYLLNLSVSGGDNYLLYKHGTLGLRAQFKIGGVTKIVTIGTIGNTTDWFFVYMTWADSANGDEAKVYLNGSQSGATQTGFGAWAGVPSACRIGQVSPNNSVWKGWLAYVPFNFGSVLSQTNIANAYADRLSYGPDVNPP